ncbi:MAG TPA: hypothetical protein VKD67_01155, partial [Acidimicrobiales bacterium]|nr:hypothetical protein [Acidimicrobiales bacterium]
LAVYGSVPILMVMGVLAQRRSSTAVPAPSGLPLAVRVVLVTMSAVLLGLGVALIVAPGWAGAAWPWPLTPLTSGAVGAWLVGLGVATAHAWVVNDRASLQPLALTGVLFGALQALALARHGGDLDWSGVPAVAYVAGLATLTLVSAWALLPARRQSRCTQAAPNPTVAARAAA